MKNNFGRRDFVKLAGLLPLSLAAPHLVRDVNPSRSSEKQNVLIVIFDALSALNIPFHGYDRETTPNLTRLSERAVVYHNHYATGNFTTPGTASILTGTLPWTNRAIQPLAGVADSVISQNIFNAFEGYYRIAYTHNNWAYILLKQCEKYMDELVPRQKLFLQSYDGFIQTFFYSDDDIATVSWSRDIEIEQGYSYSLFLSRLYKVLRERIIENIRDDYPRGIPSTSVGANIRFVMEHATQWIGNHLAVTPQPFLGYFHFLPPHAPYRTSREFYERFNGDGFKVPGKPTDLFADKYIKINALKERAKYDEFILYADKAFGDLYAFLEESGLLENTWVIFTSDHGEMFERGIYYHRGPTLYQPVIRVPLLIFEPGRKIGAHIRTPTSAIDLLPTLLHVTGHKIPEWIEGETLPPYAPAKPDPNRSLFVVQADYNHQYAPLTQATTSLIKEGYKLIHYMGYDQIKQGELVQLFDLESDPEELMDLHASKPEIAKELLAELKARMAEADKPFL